MKLFALFAGAIVSAISGTAHAQTMTKTYTVTSTFGTGPVPTEVQSFTATFDPTMSATSLSVTGYTSSSAIAAFNVPLALDVTRTGNFSTLNLYGVQNGTSLGTLTNDFSTQFRIDLSGSPALVPFVVTSYTNGSGSIYDSTAGVAVATNVTSAVPEPATWAMMIGGFGIVGGTLRRRPRAAIAHA